MKLAVIRPWTTCTPTTRFSRRRKVRISRTRTCAICPSTTRSSATRAPTVCIKRTGAKQHKHSYTQARTHTHTRQHLHIIIYITYIYTYTYKLTYSNKHTRKQHTHGKQLFDASAKRGAPKVCVVVPFGCVAVDTRTHSRTHARSHARENHCLVA